MATILDTPKNIADYTAPLIVAAADAPSRYRALAPASLRCDGADDDAHINEAIEYAVANKIPVLLSPGTFIYRGQIVLLSGLVMGGVNRSLTTLKLADGTDPSSHHMLISSKSDIWLQDFTLDGNGSAQSVANGDGIAMFESQFIHVHRVGVKNLKTSSSWGNGIRVDNCQDIDLIGGFSTGCRHGVATTTGGTRDVRTIGWTSIANVLEGIHYSEGQRGVIQGNICRANGGHNLSITSASRTTVQGNILQGSVGGSGIACSAAPYTIINGNECLENGQDGIVMGISDVQNEGWIITSNICKDNGRDGIRVRSARRFTLALNRTSENGGDGINIASVVTNRGDGLVQSNVCHGEDIVVDSTNLVRLKLYDNFAKNIVVSGEAAEEVVLDRNTETG